MTAQSNDMFKVVSLRGALSLGGEQTTEEKTVIARRQAILRNTIGPGPSDDEEPSKLQSAQEGRETLMRQLRVLAEVRAKLTALGHKRMHDAFQATTPSRAEVLVGGAKPGAVEKVTAWLFGTKPATLPLGKPMSFTSPVIDAQVFDDLARSFESDDHKKLIASLRFKADSQVVGGLAMTPEMLEAVAAEIRAEFITEANAACRRIHLWEDDARLPDTQAKSEPVTDKNRPRPAVRAIGFGDLIVARERLIGYDAREVAHIENVLPGENRLREHEELTKREAETETMTEEETKSRKDLETTDRFELQVQSQKSVNTEMKLEAGLNVSGTYGVTTVEASLDAGFTRSQQESQSTTSNLARETVSRAVQDIQKSTRERRRITVTEQIREFNHHGINGEEFTAGYSGVYYWVEKIHEVELQQYGTRQMVEFFIPEPALSLLPQNAQSTQKFRKPAPLTISPGGIGEDNYLCLTALYGAVDVEPPPPEEVQVGYGFASTPNTSWDKAGAQTHYGRISIPALYLPVQASFAVSNYFQDPEYFFSSVSIGGLNFLMGITSPNNSQYGPFDLTGAALAPDGLPVTILASFLVFQAFTQNIKILCKRTDACLQAWQLKTFQRLKEAHDGLMNEYERQVARAQIQSGIDIEGRPPAENRLLEVEELTKWAIKTMRLDPFNFNAVVRQQEREEIDPIVSDAYAPIMRFFQDAFEWRHMSYILYPYFWGRRDCYGYRSNLVDSDPLHQAFLRAGAARVIVPVTPGYEERVLHYLDTHDAKGDDGSLLDELQRIGEANPKSGATDIWLEVLLNKNDRLSRGSGSLSVEHGKDVVILSPDSLWIPLLERDVGRELVIDGDFYEITNVDVKLKASKKITDPDFWDHVDENFDWRKLTISPCYRLAKNTALSYAVGSVRVGKPWTVRVPTSLVILAEETSKLYKDIDNKIPLTASVSVLPVGGD